MKNYLLLILLLVSATSIAQSLPGKPLGSVPAVPCLTLNQRVRLGDSLAMLPRVRRAAREYRTAADTATKAANVARYSARNFSNALVAQQRLTTDASAQATSWKSKARRRGLLNWLFIAAAGGLTYLSIK